MPLIRALRGRVVVRARLVHLVLAHCRDGEARGGLQQLQSFRVPHRQDVASVSRLGLCIDASRQRVTRGPVEPRRPVVAQEHSGVEQQVKGGRVERADLAIQDLLRRCPAQSLSSGRMEVPVLILVDQEVVLGDEITDLTVLQLFRRSIRMGQDRGRDPMQGTVFVGVDYAPDAPSPVLELLNRASGPEIPVRAPGACHRVVHDGHCNPDGRLIRGQFVRLAAG